MNAVPSPVVVEDARELGQIHVQKLLGIPCIRCRDTVIGESTCPGRPPDVLAHWQILDGANRQANDYAAKGSSEAPDRDRPWERPAIKRRERQEQRICSAGE